MFKLKKKTTSEDKPKKKKIKWILLVIAILLFFIIIGSGDNDDGIPTLEDELSDYIEPYSQKQQNGVTMKWYKISKEGLSEIKDYVELLCDEHEFKTVDGKDNDYYLYHENDDKIGVLYTDNGNQEYHLRIGIPTEDEEQSLISFIYVDGLFEETEKSSSDADEKDKIKNQGKEVVLASEVNMDVSAGQKQDKNSVKFQSVFDYFYPTFSFEDAVLTDDGMWQRFEGSEKDIGLFKEYVEFLCADGMNFTQKNHRLIDLRGVYTAIVQEETVWGLSYTGTASVEEPCYSVLFSNSERFAITIGYTIDAGKLKGYIYWSPDLEPCDLGFRSGGKTVSPIPGGKSALTGLVKTADGKFKTADGRFSANLNEVVLLENGKTTKGKLEYRDSSPDLIRIYDSMDNKKLTVIFPASDTQKAGTIYGLSNLIQRTQYTSVVDPFVNIDEKPIVYQFADTKWITATATKSPCKDMTMRIMYYNKAEQIAVYYIYTYFTEETEAFCVVDLSKAITNESQNSSGGDLNLNLNSNSGSGNSSQSVLDCISCNGSRLCQECGGSGFLWSSAADTKNRDCPKCILNKGKCSTCGGSGKR